MRPFEGIKPNTGIYRNDAKCQYEMWAVNFKTGEQKMLAACSYSVPEQDRRLWERGVWFRFLGVK